MHLKMSSGKWRPSCLSLNVVLQHILDWQCKAISTHSAHCKIIHQFFPKINLIFDFQLCFCWSDSHIQDARWHSVRYYGTMHCDVTIANRCHNHPTFYILKTHWYKATQTLIHWTSSVIYQWWISFWAKVMSMGLCFSYFIPATFQGNPA